MNRFRTFSMGVLLICAMASVSASPSDHVSEALERTKSLHVEEAFACDALQAISGASMYEATYGFAISEDYLDIALQRYFLVDDEELTAFHTKYQLLCSEQFINSIRTNFSLQTIDDGLLFQEFLYAVDDNFFNEGFFIDGNTWVFVRDEFFGDIEAYLVETDDYGSITSISYDYEADIVLGDELYTNEDFDFYYDEGEYAPVPEKVYAEVEAIMTGEFDYEVQVSPITSQWLAKTSMANWYSCEISILEEYDDMTSTSWYERYALEFKETVYIFAEFDQLLTSSVYIESIQPDFFLTDDASAELFELALDQVSDFDRKEKARFERNGSWVFIRSEFFDDGTGYIVDTDDMGRITTISYLYDIPLEGVEVPIEIPFDESSVEWTFALIEPASASIHIPEAEDVHVLIEFNEWAANQIGAWVGTFWQGELVGMHAGSSITSPFADHIPAEVLTEGDNRVTYMLLRPGRDYDNPLVEEIELSIWVGD